MKVFLVIALFFASCNSSGSVMIPDASRDTLIEVKTNASYPVILDLRVQGQTDEAFIINNVTVDGGRVDTTIRADWYTKNFSINFRSQKVKKGSLKITYTL